MVIVLIKRKLLKVTLIIALVLLCGIITYGYLQSRSNSLFHSTSSELFNNKLGSFIDLEHVSYNGQAYIEIFDINKGEVIKKVESTSTIQQEAHNYLDSITGMVVKVKAFPEKGHIVKIPLVPPVKIENKYLNSLVNEVFVMFPGEGSPYLMVLDYKGRPEFYNFSGNTDVIFSLLQ